LVVQGGNSGRAGNINIAVNIALINIHVSLIFLNNSWNHSTDKSKLVFRFIRISLDNISNNSYEIDIFLILSIFLIALENTFIAK